MPILKKRAARQATQKRVIKALDRLQITLLAEHHYPAEDLEGRTDCEIRALVYCATESEESLRTKITELAIQQATVPVTDQTLDKLQWALSRADLETLAAIRAGLEDDTETVPIRH
jgi:hypothetical protein